MERYIAGEDSAFAELYDGLAPRLFGFILRVVRDRARAEDFVQQTMLQVHCAKSSFARGARVTPWALTIIWRLFLDQKRSRARELLSLDEDSAPEQASCQTGPEDAALQSELRCRVRYELSRLVSSQREAVELVYYAQLSHAEAAEALGVSVASIKLRVQRAGHTIRAAVEAAGDGCFE